MKGRAAQIAGVSLSPSGFYVLLECSESASSKSSSNDNNNTLILPIQVTNDSRDVHQASSPQALTLLQLLAAPLPVDMAGPVFPVETLTKLIVVQSDLETSTNEQEYQEQQHPIINYLQSNIAQQLQSRFNVSDSSWRYSQQPDWIQARLSLPLCSLHRVQLHVHNDSMIWYLTVRALDMPVASSLSSSSSTSTSTSTSSTAALSSNSLTFAPSEQALRQVVWRDDETNDEHWNPQVAAAFTCLALALRYKAPIFLTQSPDTASPFISKSDVSTHFPLYKSQDELVQAPTRVHRNIETGFAIHKLQAALQLAMQKGDVAAAHKIRARLDEMDSMQDLPVQAEHDLENMQ
ncbi:hypothetical protein MPSEU_000328200 [Mayamaea pseudoterrestris]|nr:hypothetical protein MPSEU_000328200 [Mayamaea pseudoterrestris]